MSDRTDVLSSSLRATYYSHTGHKDFSHTLTAPPVRKDGAVDLQAKTKYLSELRASTKTLQQDINKFLTAKMEEDKQAIAQNDLKNTSKQKSKDELEEENYGEENAEDET